MSAAYDIAIAGSGFAGSLLAMIARRAGRSVVLLEKGSHPRFAIGESSTPLANLLLEELCLKYDLPRLLPLTKWGSWQQSYPQIACGLKRGFSFYHHANGDPRRKRDRQLLVAASPNDAISDTHWYRADFDRFFVQEAQAMGADYFDRVSLHTLQERQDGVTVAGERSGRPVAFHARLLVDATGPRGFVHQALRLPEALFPNFPQTQSLYTHFSNVARFHDSPLAPYPPAPYPPDDAALHHVFDGGWIWVLRFNNGLTSAGVAATSAVADRLHFQDGAAAWRRLLKQLPTVEEQFMAANAELPFTHARRLPYLSATIARRRWAMLPSAAAFIDPLLSTGFPLTLLGVARLAQIVTDDWDFLPLQAYAAQTANEALTAARLIGALYASMSNFPLFTALSLLYFAAAGFAETARRLNKPGLASSFLLRDRPAFGPVCAALCAQAHRVAPGPESNGLTAAILRAIEPFNIAGLGNPGRKNWYPVDPQDLLRSAAKLGATPEAILRLLERCGFTAVA